MNYLKTFHRLLGAFLKLFFNLLLATSNKKLFFAHFIKISSWDIIIQKKLWANLSGTK